MKRVMLDAAGWTAGLADRFCSRRVRVVAAALLAAMLAAWPSRVHAAFVSSNQAVAAVTAWLAADTDPMDSGMSKIIGDVMVYPGADGTNAFYVVSMQPQGYVIVAANDLAGSVISFSTKGAFNPSPSSTFYRMLQVDLPRRVAYAQAQAQVKPALQTQKPAASAAGAVSIPRPMDSVPHPDPATGICRVRVAPLIASKWGQGAPYDYFTPSNAAPGHIAIFMAEIIRLHQQQPVNGVGRQLYLASLNESPQWLWTRGGDGNGGPYVWSNMVDDATAAGVTPEQQQAVATLCSDVGVAVTHNNYDLRHGTGEDLYDMPGWLESVYAFTNGGFFGNYDGTDPLWDQDEWLNHPEFYTPPTNAAFGMINANLDAGFPVLITLQAQNPLVGDWTAACDGYGYSTGTGTGPVGGYWMFHHLVMADGNAGDDIWYTLPVVPTGAGYTNIANIAYNIIPRNAGEIVSGRVVDTNNFSMAGITIQITDGASFTERTVTTNTGIYSFIVPGNASYTVSVVPPIGTPVAWPTPPSQTISVGRSSNWGACGNIWGVNFKVASQLIAGRIIKDGAPLVRAQVTFSNAANSGLLLTLQTDLDGYFVTPVPNHWSGTLTPWLSMGGTFNPPSTNILNITGNITNIVFTWTAPTMFAISGTVFRADTLDNVTNAVITFSGVGVTAQTDAQGDYVAYVPTNWSGTATPSHPDGGVFYPTNRVYGNLSHDTGFQYYFWAPPQTNTISGWIMRRDTGDPVPGVVLTTSDGQTATTDATGAYSLTVPYLWSGTVTPSHPRGGVFLAVSRSYSSIRANVSGQNFLWTPPLPTIIGVVTRSDYPYGPAAGVTITLSGSAGKASTAADGSYQILVPIGWSGTAVPSHPAGGVFSPTNMPPISTLTNDVFVQDYRWTPPVQTVSGRVVRADNGNPVPGTMVTFVNSTNVAAYAPEIGINGASVTVSTDSNGWYGLFIPYGWSGSSSPSNTVGGLFNPAGRTYINLSASRAADGFAWTPPSPWISGRVVRYDDGTGVSNVVVVFSNDVSMLGATNPLAVVVTDTNGYYQATVGNGWSGTVTPVYTQYAGVATFSPVRYAYTNVQTEVTATNRTQFILRPPPAWLVAVVSPSTRGTITIGGWHATIGATASITVTPNSVSRFVNWQDGVTNAGRIVVLQPGTNTYTAFCVDKGPEITISGPDSVSGLDFGNVFLGKVATRTIVVRNTGTSACNVLGTATTFGFQALPNSYILNPGASRAVTLTFTPPAEATLTGTVMFATYPEPASGAPHFAVQGTGVGLEDVLTYSGSTDFGTMFVGQTASHTLTIYNNGPVALKLSAKLTSGLGFSVSGFPATVAGGGSKQFTLRFVPTTVKNYGGAVLSVSASGIAGSAVIYPTVTVNANVAGTWTAKLNSRNYTLYLRQNGSTVDGMLFCTQNGAVNDQYVASINTALLTGALWQGGAPVGALTLTASGSSLSGLITSPAVGTNLPVKWSRSSSFVPISVVFPPRPAALIKPAVEVVAGAAVSLPVAALRVTLLDLAPAELLPEDAELLVVTLAAGRPVAVSPALDALDLSWLLQSRIEAEGVDANVNGLPDAIEAALGAPLQDGVELLIVRKRGGYAVPDAPYAGTAVDGAAVPLGALPATWSLTPKKP